MKQMEKELSSSTRRIKKGYGSKEKALREGGGDQPCPRLQEAQKMRPEAQGCEGDLDRSQCYAVDSRENGR